MTDIRLHATTVRVIKDRGGTWAVYRNTALDSANFGETTCLRYGPGCTFKTAPDTMPDTPQHGPGWKYCRIALIDSQRLPDVDGDVEVLILPQHAPDPAGGKHV